MVGLNFNCWIQKNYVKLKRAQGVTAPASEGLVLSRPERWYPPPAWASTLDRKIVQIWAMLQMQCKYILFKRSNCKTRCACYVQTNICKRSKPTGSNQKFLKAFSEDIMEIDIKVNFILDYKTYNNLLPASLLRNANENIGTYVKPTSKQFLKKKQTNQMTHYHRSDTRFLQITAWIKSWIEIISQSYTNV